MKAGHRDELVQDAPLLGPPAVAVSLDDRRHEFIPRRHAHPPHRDLPDPIRVGSISDQATDQHSGTFLARQCAVILIVALQRTFLDLAAKWLILTAGTRKFSDGLYASAAWCLFRTSSMHCRSSRGDSHIPRHT